MRAIIQLAHSLKLTVVAEGVETEAQRDILDLLGCDHLQGFLLGRPLPADAFEAMLEFMAAKQFLKKAEPPREEAKVLRATATPRGRGSR